MTRPLQKSLRIVFFGTPEFAVPHLQALCASNHEVVAVVTRPDKPQKRSKEPVASSVKRFCLSTIPQIPLLQPTKCSTPDFKAVLEKLAPDIFVVVAYGEIIKQFILDVPRFGAINVHASLLPKYRGAAPMQRALLNGEKETGVTIIQLVLQMDAGDILAIEKIPVPSSMTCGELSQALIPVGIRNLLKVLSDFQQGSVTPVRQNEEGVTLAPKITVEECKLDFSKSAETLHNLVRAVTPNPGAWCEVLVRNEVKRLKVLRTFFQEGKEIPQKALKVNSEGVLMIGTTDGALCVHEVQLEGKKAMPSSEFLRGIPLSQLLIV